jgi:hypothetical protein
MSRFARFGIVLVLIPFLVIQSCETIPGTLDETPVSPVEETQREDADLPAGEEEDQTAEEPPGEEAQETGEVRESGETREEVPDLAETDLPPEGSPVSVRLPEPEVPPGPPVPATPAGSPGSGEQPREISPPPVSGPASNPAAGLAAGSAVENPPPVRGEPPAPPPFLRPAEEVLPEEPPVFREPIREIPEPPAFTGIPRAGEGEDIVYSRVVRAAVGQFVEIPFRGTGWVYLGELASGQGMAYSSRRLDPVGQSFIFRAEAAGTYGLKFYKQNFIRDYILNDYVQVVVGEAPDAAGAAGFNPPIDRGRVVAEPYQPELPVPPREGTESPPAASAPVQPDTASGSPAASPAFPDPAALPETPAALTAPVPAGSLPEETTPDEYIRKSREEYDAGRVAGALAILDQFRTRFPAGSDEAWWLYGQLLEANSPSRDIRSALDCYRRLVQEYPQSSRYNDARRRIAYLERYYFNIQ